MSDSGDLEDTVAMHVPAWLVGMPEEWWDIYFDRVVDFAVSPRWGHA